MVEGEQFQLRWKDYEDVKTTDLKSGWSYGALQGGEGELLPYESHG